MATAFNIGIEMVVVVDQGMGKKVMRIGRLVEREKGDKGGVTKRTEMWDSE